MFFFFFFFFFVFFFFFLFFFVLWFNVQVINVAVMSGRSNPVLTGHYLVIYGVDMSCSKTKPGDPVVPVGIEPRPLDADNDTLTTRSKYSFCNSGVFTHVN